MEFVAEDYAWKASASSALTRSKLPFAFLSGCTMFENLDYWYGSVEDGRLLPKPSTSATVNTVNDGTKSDATIRRNVRFEFDENPESNPVRHSEKGYEINR